MNKLLLLFIVLLSIPLVNAAYSGIPYNYFNATECVGSITVRVIASDNTTDYTLSECSLISETDWTCPCLPELYMITPKDVYVSYYIRLQYYTGPLRPIDNRTTTNGTISLNQMYNDALLRVYNLDNISFEPKPPDPSEIEEGISTTVNIIFIFAVCALLIGFFVYIGIQLFKRSDEDKPIRKPETAEEKARKLIEEMNKK